MDLSIRHFHIVQQEVRLKSYYKIKVKQHDCDLVIQGGNTSGNEIVKVVELKATPIYVLYPALV